MAEIAGSNHEMLKIADGFDPVLNEIYFDRRSQYFDDILGLYQSGRLHMSADGCRVAFVEELNFWEIDEMMLAHCCHSVNVSYFCCSTTFEG